MFTVLLLCHGVWPDVEPHSRPPICPQDIIRRCCIHSWIITGTICFRNIHCYGAKYPLRAIFTAAWGDKLANGFVLFVVSFVSLLQSRFFSVFKQYCIYHNMLWKDIIESFNFTLDRWDNFMFSYAVLPCYISLAWLSHHHCVTKNLKENIYLYNPRYLKQHYDWLQPACLKTTCLEYLDLRLHKEDPVLDFIRFSCDDWMVGWAGNVAHVGEMQNAYHIIVRKPKGTELLGDLFI